MQEKIISTLLQAEELVDRIKTAASICGLIDAQVELTYKGVNHEVLMAAAQLIEADGVANLPGKSIFNKDFGNISIIVKELK